MNIGEKMLVASFFILAFSFVMLYRVDMVHMARTKAINITSETAQEMIVNGEHRDWREAYHIYDEFPGFDKMLFDLSSWGYDGLYKKRGYEKKLKDLLHEKGKNTAEDS